MTRIHRLAIVAGLLVGVAWSRGADAPQVLDEVFVSARGIESLVSQTPGGVGVVEAEDILLAQPMSLSEVTTRIPGISLSADAPWGATSSSAA